MESFNQYGSSQDRIWAGEIGTYEGAYFVESARLYNATDGSSSARVYRTILAGQQALAEAVAEEPHVVIGPVVDKLMRHRPMGWYGVLGFARYREEALYRIESGSSIAARKSLALRTSSSSITFESATDAKLADNSSVPIPTRIRWPVSRCVLIGYYH